MKSRLNTVICKLLGHKPEEFVDVALGKTPKGEPTIRQFEKWTSMKSLVVGTALADSYTICDRCGKRLQVK